MNPLRDQVERCLARFKAGQLQEEDLQGVLAALERPKQQSLLYVQTGNNSPHSNIVGLSVFEAGKDQDGVDENGKLLYQSLKEALEDGWRIVKFPDMNLVLDDQYNYGLGCEFILERWR